MKFLLFFILLFPSMIFAYENDNFEININEDMVLISDKDNIYKWVYDGEEKLPSVTVVVSDNKGYNIDSFDDEDVKSYEKYVSDKLNDNLKDYDISIEVYEGKIINLKDINTLVYNTKWNTKDSFGYDTYQKSYAFTTSKYLVSLTFEAKSEKELNNEEFNNIVNIFKIKDEKIKRDYTKDLIYFIVFILAGGLAGLTVSAIKNKIRRRKNDK